jgi:hypothetical protein
MRFGAAEETVDDMIWLSKLLVVLNSEEVESLSADRS